MTFSEKLSELQRESGLTDEELARALKVTVITVRRWKGGKLPNVPNAMALAEYFGVSLNALGLLEEQE